MNFFEDMNFFEKNDFIFDQITGRKSKDGYASMLHKDQKLEDEELKEVDKFFPEGYEDFTGATTNDR
jgi:hypothetical protein